jgi:hypothetical protein
MHCLVASDTISQAMQTCQQRQVDPFSIVPCEAILEIVNPFLCVANRESRS